VSVGLIIAAIVAIAVVLALVIDTDDDKSVVTNVNDAPMSYYVPESGDGIVGGHDQAVAPALRSHTSEYQGEGFLGGYGQEIFPLPLPQAQTGESQGDGLVNTADDLSVVRPTSRYQPYGGEVGLIDGSMHAEYLNDMKQAQRAREMDEMEQAQRAHDEMLFTEWNDPLGWQAIPEQEQTAVVPYEHWLYLEQNGVYETNRDLAVVRAPEVDSYERMKFIEQNTFLPGWTDYTAKSDREGFIEN
jgi:hypothetical protein